MNICQACCWWLGTQGEAGRKVPTTGSLRFTFCRADRQHQVDRPLVHFICGRYWIIRYLMNAVCRRSLFCSGAHRRSLFCSGAHREGFLEKRRVKLKGQRGNVW